MIKQIKEESVEVSWHYYAHFIAVWIGIMIYARYKCRRRSYKDPLQIEFIKGIDFWSLSHLIFYMYIGYHYPDTFYLSTSIGILWELIEFVNGKYFIKMLRNYGNCNGEKEIWWYGKYSDVIINILGFQIGKQLAEKFS